jgi:hypothetical protein
LIKYESRIDKCGFRTNGRIMSFSTPRRASVLNAGAI